MKKFAVILLCAAIVFASVSINVSAQTPAKELPTIVITGYGSTQLFYDFGQDDEQRIWLFSPEMVIKQNLSDIRDFVPAVLKMFTGDFYTLGKTLGFNGSEMLYKMRMNPDGSTIYNVGCYPNDPAITNLKYLQESERKEVIYEAALCGAISEQYGAQKVFIFQYDFRYGVYDIANSLEEYIDAVREYTGYEKVNLFGKSYGGFIVGTYLSMYGTQGKVKNAVMDVPAIGGTSFDRNFSLRDVDFQLESFLEIIEQFLKLESGLAARLLGKLDSSKLSDMFEGALVDVLDWGHYWGALYDLMTVEDYNDLKPLMLDEKENAEVIRKSDYIHYQIMPNYTENFRRCKEAGVNISIICNSGTDTAFGSGVNADILLDVSKVSGATAAPLGMRFDDGYKGNFSTCTDKTHNHISPSMEIDASDAYLPENTWFFEGRYHGMNVTVDRPMKLAIMLLYTDDEITVHSLPEYPQFNVSDNAYRGISAKFDVSPCGYLCNKDSALTVTNLTTKYRIKILSITCNGIDLDFDVKSIGTIKSGETVAIPFTGEIPAESYTRAAVTVNFIRLGCICPLKSMTFDIMLVNGPSPEYSGNFVPVDYTDPLSEKLNSDVYGFIFGTPFYTAFKVLGETLMSQ